MDEKKERSGRKKKKEGRKRCRSTAMQEAIRLLSDGGIGVIPDRTQEKENEKKIYINRKKKSRTGEWTHYS